jgi:hypothetical protein
MSRLILYPATQFVAAVANPPNTKVNWQTHSPEIFSKPFPLAEQQWVAQAPQQPPTGAAPAQTYEIVVINQTTIHQTLALGLPPQWQPPAPSQSWRAQLDYKFAAPFPACAQQYAIHLNYEVPTAKTPHGWEGYQLETKFAVPFPASAQQFPAFQPQGTITNRFIALNGFLPYEYDYRFTPAFPASAQQYVAHLHRALPSAPTPHGWEGQQLDARFARPFPVAEQQYEATRNPEQIFPFYPPGSGKRYKPPFQYLPQPPYEVPDKPHKPVKPIWDRGGKIEEPKPEKPKGPPPLPPLSIFGASGTTRLLSPNGLPTFNEYVPQDSAAMAKRMQEALDESDAIAALRALGLIKGE